jgi:aspartyl-tRNA(Asn)/glutamyl-tRNA(Gln) amidotransferase subunit A
MNRLTIKQALADLKTKKISASELAKAHFAAIKQHQHLNAYVTLNEEGALAQAAISDENIKNGSSRKLEGIPIGVKDLFCTSGVRTTACSKMLKDFVPNYDATVSQKILAAGAVMLGKTNCDEFAMGSSNLTSFFGPCLNPWRAKDSQEYNLVPGGSSGGSAAAVAAFGAMASLGTDTGGSIRQPASFTGTVGFKPTYGRCSRFGTIAFASSLDQAGVFARNVFDAAICLETIMGFDEKDATCSTLPVPELTSQMDLSLKGVKIGLPINLMKKDGIDSQIINMWLATCDMLKAEGAQIVDINLNNADHALPVYYILAPAEASSNLARYDGVRYGFRHDADDLNEMYEMSRSLGFGPEVKRRILIGTYMLSSGFMEAYYTKAQQVRRLIYQDFINAFADVDAIIMPSAPTESFAINIKQDNPVTMYLNDIFTIPPSLAGLPAAAVPVALSSNGLPLGMQIVAKHFDEQMLVRVSAAIERSVNTQFIPQGF